MELEIVRVVDDSPKSSINIKEKEVIHVVVIIINLEANFEMVKDDDNDVVINHFVVNKMQEEIAGLNEGYVNV